MIGEPVRGAFPDPGDIALPGMERLRKVPRSPLGRLIGIRFTQLGPGSVTATQPGSPWLLHDQSLEVTMLAGRLMHSAVLTGLPPYTDVRTAAVSIHHLRSARSEDGGVIGRAARRRCATSSPARRWR